MAIYGAEILKSCAKVSKESNIYSYLTGFRFDIDLPLDRIEAARSYRESHSLVVGLTFERIKREH